MNLNFLCKKYADLNNKLTTYYNKRKEYFLVLQTFLVTVKIVKPFLDVFLKNPSFKIAMSGRAGVGQVSPEVYLFVNLFSKLYVIFILRWIAFIFGRGEEEDQ